MNTSGMEGSESQAAGSELLPEELWWAAGGHASDVVLTALADGQHGIVPEPVRLHVERCSVCVAHLGNTALLSLHVGEQLALRAQHARSTEGLGGVARRPMPRLAIALGLAFALAGLLPSLLDGERSADALAKKAEVILRGVSTLLGRLDPDSAGSLVLSYGSALTLVAMGVALVRFLPKLAHAHADAGTGARAHVHIDQETSQR